MFRKVAVSCAALLVSACSGAQNTGGQLDSPPKQAPSVMPSVWAELPASADEFGTMCRSGLERAKAALPRLIAVKGTRTVENTLEPYNQLARDLEASGALAGVFRSVHPDESYRTVASECEKEVEEFSTSLGLNRALYDAFSSVDVTDADANTKRFLEHTLRDFRRSGVDKDDNTRDRLRAIDKELVEVGQAFSKQIVDDTLHIKVDSADQLAGLPADYVAAHKPGEDGKITITTDYPDYKPFMAYADNDELRRKLYIESRRRGGKGNEERLRRILSLRYEKAQLLGYQDWADYITEDKMMKSGANAEKFIERIVEVAKSRADRDVAELLLRMRKDDPKATVVQDWQKTYYENKVKKEKYDFDAQSVRPYLSFGAVQQGLLDITGEIYGIQYVKIDEAPIWHGDVQAYEVVRDGTRIGRIYLDMHPREGKYKHAAQFTLQSGITGKQLPEGILVCNFPKSLMEHDDVVTMFHEFGHLMHHVLGGNQKWITQSGVTTEWDFVEAPSQMFEEWAWSHGTLSRFAKHKDTGEVISTNMVDRMRAADKFGLGIQTTQQMFYASLSLHYHRGNPADLDLMAKLKELQAKYTPFPYVEGTRFYSNFGHLNGYSAMYYTYMWSLVIAKDMLTPFKEHGLMNQEWTHKYRDVVLGAGGTHDAADLVEAFLGRKHNFKAFEKYLSE